MSLSKLRGKEFINVDLGISLTTYKDEGGSILFVAPQVARALGYKKPNDAIRRHVKPKHRRIIGTGDCTRGVSARVENPVAYTPNTVLITEPGFWSLTFGSKLPVADELRDWVFEEVLPSIREYGYYALPGVLEAILKIDVDDVKALTDGSYEKKEFRKESKLRSDLFKDKTAMENGKLGAKQKNINKNVRKFFYKWLTKTFRSRIIRMRFLETENERLRNCLRRISEDLDDSEAEEVGGWMTKRPLSPEDLSDLSEDEF